MLKSLWQNPTRQCSHSPVITHRVSEPAGYKENQGLSDCAHTLHCPGESEGIVLSTEHFRGGEQELVWSLRNCTFSSLNLKDFYYLPSPVHFLQPSTAHWVTSLRTQAWSQKSGVTPTHNTGNALFLDQSEQHTLGTYCVPEPCKVWTQRWIRH